MAVVCDGSSTPRLSSGLKSPTGCVHSTLRAGGGWSLLPDIAPVPPAGHPDPPGPGNHHPVTPPAWHQLPPSPAPRQCPPVWECPQRSLPRTGHLCLSPQPSSPRPASSSPVQDVVTALGVRLQGHPAPDGPELRARPRVLTAQEVAATGQGRAQRGGDPVPVGARQGWGAGRGGVVLAGGKSLQLSVVVPVPSALRPHPWDHSSTLHPPTSSPSLLSQDPRPPRVAPPAQHSLVGAGRAAAAG